MRIQRDTLMNRVRISTLAIHAEMTAVAGAHSPDRFIDIVSIERRTEGSSARTARRRALSRVAVACAVCTLTSALAWAQPTPRSTEPVIAPQTSSVLAAADAVTSQPSIGSLSLPRVLPLTVQERPSVWRDLFADTWSDARRLPSKSTLGWLAIGAVAAAGARPADSGVVRSLSKSSGLHEVTESGAYIGSTPIQLGLGAATYFIGRARQSSRLTTVGAELFRAQLLSEGLTMGIKQSVRRNRPQGGGFAFPSGHTTVSFASATVLQQNYGWRVGGPAYALASFVALSRVQMKRHYLSDVAFGAALGIAAGRTVAFGPSRRIVMTPTVVDGGGGVQFVWTK